MAKEDIEGGGFIRGKIAIAGEFLLDIKRIIWQRWASKFSLISPNQKEKEKCNGRNQENN